MSVSQCRGTSFRECFWKGKLVAQLFVPLFGTALMSLSISNRQQWFRRQQLHAVWSTSSLDGFVAGPLDRMKSFCPYLWRADGTVGGHERHVLGKDKKKKNKTTQLQTLSERVFWHWCSHETSEAECLTNNVWIESVPVSSFYL